MTLAGRKKLGTEMRLKLINQWKTGTRYNAPRLWKKKFQRELFDLSFFSFSLFFQLLRRNKETRKERSKNNSRYGVFVLNRMRQCDQVLFFLDGTR